MDKKEIYKIIKFTTDLNGTVTTELKGVFEDLKKAKMWFKHYKTMVVGGGMSYFQLVSYTVSGNLQLFVEILDVTPLKKEENKKKLIYKIEEIVYNYENEETARTVVSIHEDIFEAEDAYEKYEGGPGYIDGRRARRAYELVSYVVDEDFCALINSTDFEEKDDEAKLDFYQ